MSDLYFALHGAGSVLVVGLLLGAGLPAIFALGVRALSLGQTTEGAEVKATPLGKALAAICFGIVALAILVGIGTIIAHGLGAVLTFEGWVPVFKAR